MALTSNDFSHANKFLVIDTHQADVTELRARVDSNFVSIDNIDLLVEEFSSAASRGVNITIVISRFIPADIRVNNALMRNAIQLTDEAEDINIAVYEIDENETQTYEHSKVFPTIDALVEYSKEALANSAVSNVNVDDESKAIIDELNKNNQENLQKLKDAKSKLDETLSEHDNLTAEISSLKLKLSDAQAEMNKAQTAQKSAEDKYDSQVDHVEALQIRIDNLNKQISEKEVALTDATIKAKKVEELYQGSIAEINAKSVEIADMKQQIERLSNQSITLESSNSEVQEKLEQADADMKRLAALRDENAQLRNENTSMQVRLDTNKQLIETLRANTVVDTDDTLPVIQFQNIRLMYFRVLSDIPRFHWYIKKMRSMLEELSKQRVTIVDIRRDHELDVQFIGINKVSNIGSAEQNENYLIPNSSMHEGQRTFENNTQILIVLDYTGKRDALVTTNGVNDDYVVVADSKDVKKIDGISGAVISQDDESLLDLMYDEDFIRYPETADRLADDKLGMFLSSSQVAKSLL